MVAVVVVMCCCRVWCGAVERPKVVRTCGAFSMFTAKCASHHNTVHVSTSQLPKVLRTHQLSHTGPRNVLSATTACTFSTSQLPKVLRTWHVFNTPDFEMCFAPQRRALFQHLNFQKRSEPGVFNTPDFEMCFAPQRRALFRHLTFQKCSAVAMLLAFWLGNVLRATTACTFWTSQLPKVLRRWCAL